MGIKNKRGWIRIIEAFVAILLIASIMLMVVSKESSKDDQSEKIYDDELSILKDIELNQTLRNEILGLSSLPVEWEEFPEKTKERINQKMPVYLECEGKICDMDDNCLLDSSLEKDLYTKSVIIAANSETYSPRQLKLFCWVK